jgi:signal transduction histidine kinase
MKDLSQPGVREAQTSIPPVQHVAPEKRGLRFYLNVASDRHHEFAARLANDAVARYAMAFFSVGAALLSRWLLDPLLHEYAPFATLYVAVVVTARYCGMGPALVATVLGLFGADYWFISPAGPLYVANGAQFASLIAFLLTSMVIVMMTQGNRRSLRALNEFRKRLEESVKERTAELEQANVRMREQAETLELANRRSRRLTAQLLQVQDEERRRIARDLHDSTGQTLACLVINLSLLHNKIEKVSPELGSAVAESVELARQVSADLRTISYLLHPPMLDEMGLAPALQCYVQGLRKRSQINVTFQLENDLGRLPTNCETAIFRIVQAALTNIQLHSGSQTALIHLQRSVDTVILMIKDEGKGIPPEKLSQVVEPTGTHGLGLRGIRERVEDLGGRFEIASGGQGTQITVVIPVPVSAARAAAG